jgi:hypothetical protein
MNHITVVILFAVGAGSTNTHGKAFDPSQLDVTWELVAGKMYVGSRGE